MFDDGKQEVQKKKSARKPRNRRKGEVRKVAAKLLITKNWRAAVRHRRDGRKKLWEVMARKRVEQPQEEEEEEEKDDDDDDDEDTVINAY